MESSAEQALILGINLFILIIALTCAIMLMTTVLDMSNAANTTIKTTMNSSLMTLYGGTNERIYTGEQLLALVSEYLSPTNDMKNKYDIYIDGESLETRVENNENNNLNFSSATLNSSYSLKYYGKEDSGLKRDIYKFEKIIVQ